MQANSRETHGLGLYSSRIIKAGAAIGDTLALLHSWDQSMDVDANLVRIRNANVLSKTTRSRLEDVLSILRQRYLGDPTIIRVLTIWLNAAGDGAPLRRLLYLYSAISDYLLRDVVLDVLLPLQSSGQRIVLVSDLLVPLRRWVAEGRMVSSWNDATLRRVVEGMLATLRDFGLLEGVVHKRFAPFTLPIPAAAYIAFLLYKRLGSGLKVVEDWTWRLFFLDPQGAERLLLRAHQAGLLQYEAAGSLIRLEFPTDDLEVYARVAAKGAASPSGV